MQAIELKHATQKGESKTCRNAFFDWHAASHMVDYYNYHCAQRAIAQGYVLEDIEFLGKDFSIPTEPQSGVWTEAKALSALKSNAISEQKYGYIIGMLEMTYRESIEKAKAEYKAGGITKAVFEQRKQQAYDAFYGK